MARVRWVFDDIHFRLEATLLVDFIDGRELNNCNGLGNVQNFLQPPLFFGVQVTGPSLEATSRYILHHTPVEVCLSIQPGRKLVLLLSKSLLDLLLKILNHHTK